MFHLADSEDVILHKESEDGLAVTQNAEDNAHNCKEPTATTALARWPTTVHKVISLIYRVFRLRETALRNYSIISHTLRCI